MMILYFPTVWPRPSTRIYYRPPHYLCAKKEIVVNNYLRPLLTSEPGPLFYILEL